METRQKFEVPDYKTKQEVKARNKLVKKPETFSRNALTWTKF